jgi:hypothetical protein
LECGRNTYLAKRGFLFLFLGVGNVEIIVGTTSHFSFGENALEMKMMLHGYYDGLCVPV